MIDQVMDKMGDYGEMEEEVVEVDSTLDPYEDKKIIIQQVIDLLKTEKRAGNDVIKDFIKTHYEDIINLRDDQAILDEFEEFLSVNTDYVDETDAYDNDEETQDMIDQMRKDGKDADDFVDEKKLNEEGAEDANYKMGEAFKRYGIDLSRDVIVAEMDGGTAGLGGGQVDIGPPEPAMLVAKRLERHRLDTILDYESEDQMRDFPVMYEDGFYGDYTPEGTEHKLTYSEDEGTMWDIFQAPSGVSEKKGKDHDGDGDIDGDDYKSAKDKAIKKAMGKDEQLKEAIKKIIKSSLLNEAATAKLSDIGDKYGDYKGMQVVINDLENIVTDMEGYFSKVRERVQSSMDKIGQIETPDGMKVGAFLAPAIESAFFKDLNPVRKLSARDISLPQVKTISSADIAAARAAGDIEEQPKQTMFGVNEKK